MYCNDQSATIEELIALECRDNATEMRTKVTYTLVKNLVSWSAIHYRFANISYVRAAHDDRIVDVVDECKGQSL